MEPLNNIDVIILIGFAVSMLVAFIRGFIKEILSILGMVLFLLLTMQLLPKLTPWMNQYISSKIMAQFVVFLLIMAVFYVIWIIGTDKLITRIRTSTLSFMDRLFGLLFGFLRAVLILGFCFLIVKIVLPEELEEDGHLKESKYFMMAEPCSDLIEKMLPDDFVKNAVKSVEDLNKPEKTKAKDTKKKQEDKKEGEKAQSKGGLPSKLDQEQMDKMFELLVKPEVKNSSEKESKKITKKSEKTGYDSKEANSLDRLIDITSD